MRGPLYVKKLTQKRKKFILLNFSVTYFTEQDWDFLSYWRTFQLCKHSSSFCTPLHSPLHTQRL